MCAKMAHLRVPPAVPASLLSPTVPPPCPHLTPPLRSVGVRWGDGGGKVSIGSRAWSLVRAVPGRLWAVSGPLNELQVAPWSGSS